jgi:leader peptidase (prepilin peptidase) / N-methyltransferase
MGSDQRAPKITSPRRGGRRLRRVGGLTTAIENRSATTAYLPPHPARKLATLPRGGGRDFWLLALLLALAFTSDLFAQHRRVWIPPEPTAFEKLVMSLVHVAVYFWVFLLGSVIGSYLNVVAYRLPLGKPLFWPPSSCPSCGSRIAIRDNIPVLGWIMLEGKCRNCRQPISKRYPIVEAIVGGLFLLLALVELFTDGANIPYREYNRDWGLLTTVLFPRPALIAQFLFHAAWMSTLVAVVLIDLDKQRQPAKTILLWMGWIAVIAVALSPELLPVKVVQARWANEHIEAVVASLVGMAAGLLIGRMHDRRFDGSVPLVLALTGAYFGWQAVVATALLGMLLAILGGIFWKAPPLSFWISVAALTHLLVWRQWTGVPQLPGPETLWWISLIYLAVAMKP